MALRFVNRDDSSKARVTMTRALRHTAGGCPGFTLLEVVLVISIMAIFSAIAVPRYVGSLAYSRAEAAARKVASDLSVARSLAMTSSKPQAVVFSVATGTYQLSGQLDREHPAFGYLVDLSAAPYKSQLVSASFGGSATVTFDIYGVPDRSGTVVVGSGSRKKSIVLDATSGRTTIQ